MAYGHRARRSALGIGLCTALAACSGTSPKSGDGTASTAEEIIGGVSADSPALDAVGALAEVYDWGYMDDSGVSSKYVSPFCSATLIGPATVLSAKHCLEGATGRNLYFVMGPDATAPRRMVRIIDVELARPSYGGFVGMGADISVGHLEEKILDVPVRKVARLTDADVGRRVVAIGYGIRDNGWQYGTRRMGSVTVRSLNGPVFHQMFGSFEAFVDWSTAEGYTGMNSRLPNPFAPAPSSAVVSASAPNIPLVGFGVWKAPTVRPPSVDAGGAVDSRIVDSNSSTEAAIDVGPADVAEDVRPDGPDGPDENARETGFDVGSPYDSWLQYQYDNTLLFGDHEVYVGNMPGDVQPCRGDSGGPLLGKAADGSVRIFGVTSWGLSSPRMTCDYGAVYARFSPENVAWIEAAANWVDPCEGGITGAGICQGDVATRCTELGEGVRRVTKTDCSEIGLACGIGAEGATCVAPGTP